MIVNALQCFFMICLTSVDPQRLDAFFFLKEIRKDIENRASYYCCILSSLSITNHFMAWDLYPQPSRNHFITYFLQLQRTIGYRIFLICKLDDYFFKVKMGVILLGCSEMR